MGRGSNFWDTTELVYIVSGLAVAFFILYLCRSGPDPNYCSNKYDNVPLPPATDSEKLLTKILIEKIPLSSGLDIPCFINFAEFDVLPQKEEYFRQWRYAINPRCQMTLWNTMEAYRYLQFIDQDYADIFERLYSPAERSVLFGLVLIHHEGGVFISDTRATPKSPLSTWSSHKGVFTLAASLDSACSFAKNGSVPVNQGIVLAASPKHVVLEEALKRIKSLHMLTESEREDPSVSFFKIVASSALTDSSICERTDRPVLSETGLLLLPDGDMNPLWNVK